MYLSRFKRTKKFTIAVSSRAISRVPVTRRKMMKMLMILSSDRSNHTIIYVHIERRRIQTGRNRRSGGKQEGERKQIQSQCNPEEGENIQ